MENLSVLKISFKKILFTLFFVKKISQKNFSKNFTKKTISSLPPTKDLQNLINQSPFIKTTTRQSRLSIKIITTTITIQPFNIQQSINRHSTITKYIYQQDYLF
jgi:ABC-type bacteriocin/lantibiotic exporter with double-glycine peptidase domain